MKTSIQNMLQIHAIACSAWKLKLKNEFFTRLDDNQEISLSQKEVKEMFAAANTKQLPVLEEIFGKQAMPIEWDKIKTGSKVKIKYTGSHCSGISEIDVNCPVEVVFYKTPHLISNRNIFYKSGTHKEYCTFNQEGKFVSFASDINELEYITEVIEY